MDNKTISVVICSYNGGRYIRQQIESILAQTYQPTEIIVQDDSSSDDTVEVVHRMAEKESRIKLFTSEGHKGINRNFRSAIDKASCELIAWSDQDDIWREDKLEKQVERFERNENLWICFHITQPFKGEYPDRNAPYDRRVPNFGLERYLFLGTIPGHTMLFSRDFRDYVNNVINNSLFDRLSESFFYDAMMGIVADAFHKVECIVEPLDFHRILPTSASNSGGKIDYSRSVGNAIRQLLRNINPKRRKLIRPFVQRRFNNMNAILSHLPESPYTDGAKKIIRAYNGKLSFITFPAALIKYRDCIFFSRENKQLTSIMRALIFPITMLDYFQIGLKHNNQV